MQVRVMRGLMRLFGCGIPVGAFATSGSDAVVSLLRSVVIRAKCVVGKGETVGLEDVTGMVGMMTLKAFVSASKSVGERAGVVGLWVVVLWAGNGGIG